MKSLNRTKINEEHIDSEGSWAISYGDMITLLMSFFVLYYTVDHTKIKAANLEKSLIVRLQEGGVKPDQDALKQQLNIGTSQGTGVDPRIMEEFGAEVYKIGQELVIDFQNVSFFDFGQVDINRDGGKALEKFAQIYQPFAGQYQLRIQAFTDTRKVRWDNPRFKDNLELSALRSVSSMRALQKAGLPLSRMKIAGYGELMATQEKLQKHKNEKDPLKYNRKVVLVVEPISERN